MLLLRSRQIRTLPGFGQNSSVLGLPATSPRMPTWPSSQWSAGISYIRPIPISPALAVFVGLIRARKPEGDNTVKGGARAPDVLATTGAGGPPVEGDYDTMTRVMGYGGGFDHQRGAGGVGGPAARTHPR